MGPSLCRRSCDRSTNKSFNANVGASRYGSIMGPVELLLVRHGESVGNDRPAAVTSAGT